jgi:hypothetical protein
VIALTASSNFRCELLRQFFHLTPYRALTSTGILETSTMKSFFERTFILAAWAVLVLFNSRSWAADEPDLSATQRADVEHALQCKQPKTTAALQGCAWLAAFAKAQAPDPALFSRSTSMGGLRWLGLAVVAGHASEREWMADGDAVRWNALVLGARFTSDFHRKIYFPSGVSVTYVWPNSEAESALVQQVVDAELAGRLPQAGHPLLSFASSTTLEYAETMPTSGPSLKLVDARTFVRQQGDDVYIVQIGGRDAAHPKFWVSHVSVRRALQQ